MYCGCGCGGLAPISTRNETLRGYIKGKPMRFILGHQARKAAHEYDVVDRGFRTPCHEWARGRTAAGYGMTTVNGKRVYAHRKFYEDAKGPIPKGLTIDHECNNPPCVNPDHLRPMTQADNVRRPHDRARATGGRVGFVSYAGS